jgi:hypothetical protein
MPIPVAAAPPSRLRRLICVVMVFPSLEEVWEQAKDRHAAGAATSRDGAVAAA